MAKEPTELTPIPRMRAVHYDTYANLPTTGLFVGDLGYANDNLVLYRWSGAAWQAISGRDADTLDGFHAIDLLAGPLTVAQWQANAATGTAATPQSVNDNNTGTQSNANGVGEYAEIEPDAVARFVVKQYRVYGDVSQNGDGTWKLEYWDGSAWQDWETGISTRVASWSGWVEPAAGVIITSKMRLTAVTLDTAFNENLCSQIEAKY